MKTISCRNHRIGLDEIDKIWIGRTPSNDMLRASVPCRMSCECEVFFFALENEVKAAVEHDVVVEATVEVTEKPLE